MKKNKTAQRRGHQTLHMTSFTEAPEKTTLHLCHCGTSKLSYIYTYIYIKNRWDILNSAMYHILYRTTNDGKKN